jgi:Planctomycete cytochrome C
MRFLIFSLCVCVAVTGWAELNSTEKKLVGAINLAVQKAGVSFKAGEYKAAGEQIVEAMKQIESATQGGSADLFDAITPAMDRIAKAHTMLEFEGVSLPPFRRPTRPELSAPMKEPAPPKSPAPKPSPPTTPPTPPPTTGVSFTKDVAPILVSRCGSCHVTGSKGNFSLATYAALMKGPPEGVVIFAGDTVGSRLIETIETGDMPRGGGKVTAEEMATLKAWIVAGAKFDGPDPSAPITGGAPVPTTDNAKPEVRRATGKETVSFAADVAPLLVENCTGCHINAMQARGGLQMDTFARLLNGGDSGAVIVSGKGEQSLLVQKLRGSVGERMPAGGRPALSEESIKLISTWIDEGATLDGTSADQPLPVMSQLAWVSKATPAQVSERRQQLAEKSMKLVTAAGGELATKTTEHFLVIGLGSPGTLELVAQQAEEQIKKVATVVSGQSGEAFYKGRATIFVLPKRYDYSEFAKMVEGRGIPASWSSHWSFNGIEAYVSMVATDRDEKEAIADRMTAPLISLAVATRGGDVPRWLAEGVGVAAAKRNTNTRDREVRQKAEAEMMEALAALTDAKQFLDGNLTPEQTDRIGSAIAASLLDRTHRRSFDFLLLNLSKGQAFDAAFTSAFRASPLEFVESWTRWVRGG